MVCKNASNVCRTVAEFWEDSFIKNKSINIQFFWQEYTLTSLPEENIFSKMWKSYLGYFLTIAWYLLRKLMFGQFKVFSVIFSLPKDV